MKYILSFVAVGAYAIFTSGCVSVHRDEPASTTTRTTTVDTPVTPAASVTTRTTSY